MSNNMLLMNVYYVVTGGETGLKPGSFTYSLIAAIFRADRGNLAKLRKVFPDQVAAVEQYREEGLKDIHANS